MTNILNGKCLIAFDPGHSTGWAYFDPEGHPKRLPGTAQVLGQVAGQKALVDLLGALQDPPGTVVCEEYIILDYDHRGEKAETIQTIGILKCFAYLWKAKWIEQNRSIKKVGYGMAKSIAPNFREATGQHRDTNPKDAFVHGAYFLTKHKIIKLVPPQI